MDDPGAAAFSEAMSAVGDPGAGVLASARLRSPPEGFRFAGIRKPLIVTACKLGRVSAPCIVPWVFGPWVSARHCGVTWPHPPPRLPIIVLSRDEPGNDLFNQSRKTFRFDRRAAVLPYRPSSNLRFGEAVFGGAGWRNGIIFESVRRVYRRAKRGLPPP